jgi:nitrate reductase gamma subunit
MNMDWHKILEFARGPLFQVAWLVFIGGMAYRLARVIFLGSKKDKVPASGSKLGGVAKSYLKGIVIWPFIPWVKQTFSRNMVVYLAGGLFHLGLFAVLILGTPHMLAWKSLLGFGWWTLPLPITDWLAAVAIVAMIALLINRLVNPVLKLITGPAEWLNWLLVFLPMVSGYLMTHHVINPYEKAFSLHMLSVDFLLIWIPLSRISHFIFYFFSRAIHGVEFGKRGVNP